MHLRCYCWLNVDVGHVLSKTFTFKVAVLDVRIYEQVEGEVVREYSILDLHTRHKKQTLKIIDIKWVIPYCMYSIQFFKKYICIQNRKILNKQVHINASHSLHKLQFCVLFCFWKIWLVFFSILGVESIQKTCCAPCFWPCTVPSPCHRTSDNVGSSCEQSNLSNTNSLDYDGTFRDGKEKQKTDLKKKKASTTTYNIPLVQTKSLICHSVIQINSASPRKAKREIYWILQTQELCRDCRGRSKQEKSAVAPNKDEHVTETQPKQTNQTGDSFQKKHHGAKHTKKSKEDCMSDTEIKMGGREVGGGRYCAHL